MERRCWAGGGLAGALHAPGQGLAVGPEARGACLRGAPRQGPGQWGCSECVPYPTRGGGGARQ